MTETVQTAPTEAAKPAKKLGLVIVIVVVVLAAAIFGGLYFTGIIFPRQCSPNESLTLVVTYQSGAPLDATFKVAFNNGTGSSNPGPSLSFQRGDCVEITLNNSDAIGNAHDLTILKNGVARPTDVVAENDARVYVRTLGGVAGTLPNTSKSLVFNAKEAGTYFYICSVIGHEDQGFWGQISVT